ncbi:putative quinol monooxygenase [Roseobacteraceae bacterium S113]
MYAVTVIFEIAADQIEAFMPLMTHNAQTSRDVEPGCHVFDICRDGTTIFLYELYSDRAAFDAHLQSAHFKDFDAQVGPMILSKDVRLFSEVIR